MIIVPVEPTESSFSLDVMFKPLNKVYLLRKVNGNLPYFQQLSENFNFPPCFCYNWISFHVVFCGNFIGDFHGVSRALNNCFIYFLVLL